MSTSNTCSTPGSSVQTDPAHHNSYPHSVGRNKRFPDYLPTELGIILDQFNKPFAVIKNKGNPYALAVGSPGLNNYIRQIALVEGVILTRKALDQINENLQAHAEMAGTATHVWRRIAPVPGGIEIDLGNVEHTRVRITANKVEVVSSGSDKLFYRSQVSRPMVMPAANGNYRLLKKYVNLDHVNFRLLVGWLTYTLAHPKIPSSNFVVLEILGGQGSGKSFLSRIVKDLIDPGVNDIQALPTNKTDLAIASQQSHVLCYDNLRELSKNVSDSLCTASTGGTIASRQLYTNDEQQVLLLHVALVLNGIHAFVDQPDLAQRCLSLRLESIEESQRKSEAEMLQELQADMPVIQRGLFDLVAKIFAHLPNAKVVSPERMLDFCKWLAAMEMAEDFPAGSFQHEYSKSLNQGQREALLDNVLAAEILNFAEEELAGGRRWTGTPAKLLAILNSNVSRSTKYSRDWPDNPIALSKRLQSLQAGLLTQGIRLDFGRGKERTITIETGDDE